MSHSILRSLACCALLGIAGTGALQAQTPTVAAPSDARPEPTWSSR